MQGRGGVQARDRGGVTPSSSGQAPGPSVTVGRQVATLQASHQAVVRLLNPQNSCYANATVNLLLSCPAINQFLQQCQVRQGKKYQYPMSVMRHIIMA